VKLYHYWRSSSSWRVRWCFQLKGIEAELVPVSLLSGESESPEHLARNPLGYVPVLELAPGQYLGESIAILEWADETVSRFPLLPKEALARARVRQLVQTINADTQPLQNLSASLVHAPDDPAEQKRWNRHWNENGLSAFEKLISSTAGKYSFGDELTQADLCLIPQCYAALRNDVELDRFPRVARIYRDCLELPSCQAAHPDRFKPAD
jgi:maleylacetoacetate isomerase